MLDTLTSIYMKGRWVFLAGLVISGVFVLTCHRDAPTLLPGPIAARVQEHVVQSAVDSTQIVRLEHSAAAAKVREDTADARARTAAGSGNYKVAFALEDTALTAVDREAALLVVALTRSQTWAVRGDSIIAAVLPIAESREPACRVVWVIPCPSRRAAAVAAAALTAIALVAGPGLVSR